MTWLHLFSLGAGRAFEVRSLLPPHDLGASDWRLSFAPKSG